MRTLSAKSLGELLVKVVVVVVLTGMLGHAVQRVCAAGLQSAAGPEVSVNLKASQRSQMP